MTYRWLAAVPLPCLPLQQAWNLVCTSSFASSDCSSWITHGNVKSVFRRRRKSSQRCLFAPASFKARNLTAIAHASYLGELSLSSPYLCSWLLEFSCGCQQTRRWRLSTWEEIAVMLHCIYGVGKKRYGSCYIKKSQYQKYLKHAKK